MQVNQIKISNILGIESLEFEAGKFTQITGKNGQGKTSVLEAIKAATQGGQDATLLRKGQEKGEIVLLLDNGVEITRRVTEAASTTSITKDGKKLLQPANILKQLTDMLSVNPIDFLRAPKKDKVRVLLEAMPIVADTKRLSLISGVKVSNEQNLHGLAVIDLVRKQVFDDRTGTNRAVKEKDATINQLELAMPDAPEGVTGSEDELIAKVDEARELKDKELNRVTEKLNGIKDKNTAEINNIRAELQTKIDALKEEATAKVDAMNKNLAEIEGKASQQRERTIKIFNETVNPLNLAINAIKLDRNAHAKREQAMETVNMLREELAVLVQDATRQTKAIDDIDAYKIELLSDMPVKGLEIIDGELFRDGVAFDRLNTAQQVDIAVEIAKLRAGELKICLVDGVELLDSEAFEAFQEKALASELQLFVSRVSDGDFLIK